MKMHEQLSEQEKRAIGATKKYPPSREKLSRKDIEELMGVNRYTPQKSKGNGRVLR